MAKAETQVRRVGPDTTDLQLTPTPESLVRDHATAVLGLCLANTKNLHDSEDIMQDVFLKAFLKLPTLKDPQKARAWLLQITRRACIDHHRKHTTLKPLTEDIPTRPQYDDQRVKRLHKAISRLPDSYREPITLYYLNGRSSAGVARTLGISTSAVRSRMARARLLLHEILQEDSL